MAADSNNGVKALFKYGVNATDMIVEDPKPKIVSGILAEGTDGGDYKINSSPERIYHTNSAKKYGRVIEIVDFGRLTKKKITNDSAGTELKKTLTNKLTSKAKQWLKAKCGNLNDKVTIKGIDPYYFGTNTKPIEVGDLIQAYSKPHGINITDTCLSMDIDYFDHQNDTYIIGPYIPGNFYDPKVTMR